MTTTRTSTTSAPDTPTGPLLLTADQELLGELLPLAAAADVVLDTAADLLVALAAWSRAPVVLVGADLAEDVARVGVPRRPHVYVVTPRRAPDELFRTALRIGAEQVVEVAGSAAWLVELLTDLTERRTARGRVIGVIGGSGGAGATTFACALGQGAARAGDAVLIDCDPQGPGLDRMLGLERTEGFRWDALCQTSGRLSARALREALPRAGSLGVLSWYAGAGPQTLQAFAVREALSAARRGHDVVVVDLPRTPDRLVDEVAARCDELLVATVGTLPGVSAAARVRARFADHPGAGVVLRGETVDPRDVEAAVRLPVVVQMRDQARLGEAFDLGVGPLRSARRGPLARAVADVLGAPGRGAA